MPDHFPPIKRRGAPLGNTNALKHGFYTTRLKKRDPSADESTVLKSLADEIALIRVFTQRLVKTSGHSADLSELTDILRILCLASTTITRILRVHFLITDSETILDRDIEEAIRQVNARLTANQSSPPSPATAVNGGDIPSTTSLPQEEV